jgi:enamidase
MMTAANRTLVTNIGTCLTGDVNEPVTDADHLIVRDGVITGLGVGVPDKQPGDVVHDAQGMTVLPGLIDSHVHPVFGDYTPRQSQANYLEGYVHGGVTSVVSAGEVHTPGRPKDPAGTKALALLAHKCFSEFRPARLKVHAGALLLENGLEPSDFEELATQGVHLVGEIGISGVQDSAVAAKMTTWAQAAGMTVTVHTGGASVPTSCSVDADFVITVQPDVAAHVNGGPTAPSLHDVKRILAETDSHVELVHNGNVRAALAIARHLLEEGALHRLIIGSDSPAGSGVQPLGILRTLSWLVSMAGVPAAVAVAAATGNTACARRLPGGTIAVGRPADFVLADAPMGGQAADFCGALELGDTPAVAAVFIDGDLVVRKSRNTPPPARMPLLA